MLGPHLIGERNIWILAFARMTDWGAGFPLPYQVGDRFCRNDKKQAGMTNLYGLREQE